MRRLLAAAGLVAVLPVGEGRFVTKDQALKPSLPLGLECRL
jgi:hypothetical protein